MRKVNFIAVHCTAGNQKATVNDLLSEFKHKGWKNPGYHYVVTADGVIHQLLTTDKVSNGVKGYNSQLVNIAYTGGIDLCTGKAVDNRTTAQKKSLRSLLRVLRTQFPEAVIQGHRDFHGVAKACPSFDAKQEYSDI
jgi:N-acetylmuramoyl-L-alanine amidase